ncbi:unnamed protein product [Diamesa hyperborea]
MQNLVKVALRKQIKSAVKLMTLDNRVEQSNKITQKLLQMPEYKHAKRVSIYLSTEYEVNTIEVLKDMLQKQKEVFVPTYRGNIMEMVKLNDMKDYESLPMTKWKIKQPNVEDDRENAMENAPLDLILMPGVAFTTCGGRCGHGMGYYDKYLDRYFQKYTQQSTGNNKTLLYGLAFLEQIVDESELPLDEFDYPLDSVVTCN